MIKKENCQKDIEKYHKYIDKKEKLEEKFGKAFGFSIVGIIFGWMTSSILTGLESIYWNVVGMFLILPTVGVGIYLGIKINEFKGIRLNNPLDKYIKN